VSGRVVDDPEVAHEMQEWIAHQVKYKEHAEGAKKE
jgi:hypothetical protein